MSIESSNRDIKVELISTGEVVQKELIELAEYYYELGHVSVNLTPLTRKLLIDKIQAHTKAVNLELIGLGEVLTDAAKMFNVPVATTLAADESKSN